MGDFKHRFTQLGKLLNFRDNLEGRFALPAAYCVRQDASQCQAKGRFMVCAD